MTSELEATVEYLKRTLAGQKKRFFWAIVTILVICLAVKVKEVTTLLFVSYTIALLIDPIVTKMERLGVRRSISVIALATVLSLFIAIFLGIAIPQLVSEYSILAENFPHYIEQLRAWIGTKTELQVSVKEYLKRDDLWMHLKEYASYLGEDRLLSMARGLGETLLSGYSLALTLLNLVLLPFFVYYIACDLHLIHRTLGRYLSDGVRSTVAEVGGEIVDHVAVFFRGQVMVAFIVACLYVLGLYAVGCPSALFVGATAGIFQVVPYLGVSVGVFLGTVLTLVNDPGWAQLFQVWAAFAVVQFLEGTFITPKVVGESLGIHPLGVMVALIIGGQLLGLLGVFLAIPAAAAVRVLFNHAVRAVRSPEEVEEGSGVPVFSESAIAGELPHEVSTS